MKRLLLEVDIYMWRMMMRVMRWSVFRPISPRKLPQQASSFAASASSSSSSESEVAMLRRLLEERDADIASLKLGHADAVMRGTASSAAAAGGRNFLHRRRLFLLVG